MKDDQKTADALSESSPTFGPGDSKVAGHIVLSEVEFANPNRTDAPTRPDSVANPTLSIAERSKLIDSLASGSSPIITNLLQVLAANGRLSTFPSVITDFSTLMAAHRGQLVVTVTSAEPLAAGGAEMKRLEKALKGTKIAQGKDLKLINRVNPGILGGLEVDFGEQTIDLSASSKVNKFNAALARESSGLGWSELIVMLLMSRSSFAMAEGV